VGGKKAEDTNPIFDMARAGGLDLGNGLIRHRQHALRGPAEPGGGWFLMGEDDRWSWTVILFLFSILSRSRRAFGYLGGADCTVMTRFLKTKNARVEVDHARKPTSRSPTWARGSPPTDFLVFSFSFYFSFLFSIHSGKYICMGTSRGRNEHE
jgi:hypothetical protein